MRRFLKFFRDFKSDERGALAVEYGLLVAAIATVVMAAIYGIGTALESRTHVDIGITEKYQR